MTPNASRFEIDLDVLERRPDLDDSAAIALLCSEFQLALNASHFIALSAADPEITIGSRTVPQEGVARYALDFAFVPRAAMSDRETIALVHSEFTRALNAAHFWRVCREDPSVTVATSRVPGHSESSLRWAA